MSEFENRLHQLEDQVGRYQKSIVVLIVILAAFVLFEVLAPNRDTSPVSDDLRAIKAGLVTAAMLGALGLGLVVGKPFNEDFISIYVLAGLAFVVGLAGATGIYLFEHPNVTDWIAGRLVFILGGLVVGFTWAMAKKAGAVTGRKP